MAIDKNPEVSYILKDCDQEAHGMHYFINFKNYTKASINLYSNLTLLIGKNGSGKSNLIEGVELLASLAEGKPLHEMADNKNNFSGSSFIRGGIHNCVKFGENTFSLGFDGRIGFLGTSERFDYRITVSVDPFPRVVAEYLIVGKRKIFAAEAESSDGMLSVLFDNFAKGGIKPKKNLYGDKSVISRYTDLTESNGAGDPDKKLKAIKLVAVISSYMQSSFIFDPNPKLMRDYVRSGQNTLLKDASNLSAVLQGLQIRKDYPLTSALSKTKPIKKEDEIHPIDRILDVVRQIPEEPFLKFDFIPTLQMDVLFGIIVNDRLIDARLMSDGTLRIIAVITALESIDSGSRVVIEEFDNGLHPSRAEVLIKAIMEIVHRRKLNVLLSTHNPASLNSLDGEWLKDVHVCHWSPADQSSVLTKLLDIPKVDYLLESKASLGDLITKSVFEKHLQPQFEEVKKAKAMEWLNSLKG
ncbi:ATP-binding protein [Pseudomonas sp. FJ2-5-13]|uniref:AAA family ATPase n=1 Tax=Pseudomonas sp. FJ2-5-13 TaxID=2976884 RepID=UPI0023D8BE6D|nr:ATP-binding protein [Pseudomonas sp. FJ2-5-13]WEJ05894.1 ATP-binding protein [Pseudomonas sp. FJ2-5-13]